MKKYIGILVVLILAFAHPVLAADPGTPADNECNPGGTMEGKCFSEWDWQAGWYMARYNRGLLTANQIPSTFQILLPPPPESQPVDPNAPFGWCLTTIGYEPCAIPFMNGYGEYDWYYYNFIVLPMIRCWLSIAGYWHPLADGSAYVCQ